MGDLGESPHPTISGLPSHHPTESFWQTSHPNRLVDYRSTTHLPGESTIVLIGSGITAAWIAKTLLDERPDLDILVLEARTTCSGATGRNGGHLLPLVHGQEPNVIRFEIENFHHIESFIQDNNIQCDFRRLKGCLGFWNKTYFEEAKTSLSNFQAVYPEFAHLVQVVEGQDDLKKLNLRDAEGAIVQSLAASLSPYKLIISIWEKLLDAHDSLNLQTSTPALKLRPASPKRAWKVVTSRGEIQAQHVIVATNGYTSYLLPQLEGRITPCQAQMTALRPTEQTSDRLLPASYGFMGVGQQDRVQSDYLVQNPVEFGGHLMFGGGRVFVPGEGLGISEDDFVDPVAEKYLRHLPRLLNISEDPNDPLSVDASWTGIMGFSADHFPWVGSIPNTPRMWVSAGYTGHGMPNAALCGSHLARLVLADMGNQDWHDVQQRAILEKAIPTQYVITMDRMRRTERI